VVCFVIAILSLLEASLRVRARSGLQAISSRGKGFRAGGRVDHLREMRRDHRGLERSDSYFPSKRYPF